MLIIDSDVL